MGGLNNWTGYGKLKDGYNELTIGLAKQIPNRTGKHKACFTKKRNKKKGRK